jgi:DNA-binding response OmpR family regulator
MKTSGVMTFPRLSTRLDLLLVEPPQDVGASRAVLLSSSGYTVTRAYSYVDVLDLRARPDFGYAVLSENLGIGNVRTIASEVRRRWPAARILIIGSPSVMIEDYLYDDAVDHRFNPQGLLDALRRLGQSRRA